MEGTLTFAAVGEGGEFLGVRGGGGVPETLEPSPGYPQEGEIKAYANNDVKPHLLRSTKRARNKGWELLLNSSARLELRLTLTELNCQLAVSDSVCCGNFRRDDLKVFHPNNFIKLPVGKMS